MPVAVISIFKLKDSVSSTYLNGWLSHDYRELLKGCNYNHGKGDVCRGCGDIHLHHYEQRGHKYNELPCPKCGQIHGSITKPQQETCHLCGNIFPNRKSIAYHKKDVHDISFEQQRYNLGRKREEIFGARTEEIIRRANETVFHKLNDSTLPEWDVIEQARKLGRARHNKIVIDKAEELRAKGYRVFITHHVKKGLPRRIPDIISISPDGRVIAYEEELIDGSKPSLGHLKQSLEEKLLDGNFFDEVVLDPFYSNKYSTQIVKETS